MANDISARQWVLDTVGTVWTGNVKVLQFEYYGYSLDTDTCILTDINGKVVWQGNGAADLETIRSGKIGWVNGLKLSQLDNAVAGARVLVYTE